jgi:large subunit ribosomal protein L24
MAAKLRRDDTVQVMAGKDRGRRGEVRRIITSSNRAIVAGVNMMKKHQRATSDTQPSGIIEIEAPISIANLRVVCSSCDAASRLGFRLLDGGRKVRFCKKCDEAID